MLTRLVSIFFATVVISAHVDDRRFRCSSDLFYEHTFGFQTGGNVTLKGSICVVGGNYDPISMPTGVTISVFDLTAGTQVRLAVSGLVAFDGQHIVRSNRRGNVYVMERDLFHRWNDVAELLPDPAINTLFGHAIAVDGDAIVVGSPRDEDEPPGASFVSVYRRLDGVWLQEALLVSTNEIEDAGFGEAVAISGDTLVVSDQDHQTAHIFVRNGTNWDLQARLTGPPFSRFATAVCIASNTIAIGAPNEVGGFGLHGAIYIFQRENGTWTQQAKEYGAHNFGEAAACDGDYVAASSAFALESLTTIFKRSGNTWCKQGVVRGEGAAISRDVEFSGERIVTRDQVFPGFPEPEVLLSFWIGSASAAVGVVSNEVENVTGISERVRRSLLAELHAAAREFDQGRALRAVTHLRRFQRHTQKLAAKGFDIGNAELWNFQAESIIQHLEGPDGFFAW
jgi:hypothetical protein